MRSNPQLGFDIDSMDSDVSKLPEIHEQDAPKPEDLDVSHGIRVAPETENVQRIESEDAPPVTFISEVAQPYPEAEERRTNAKPQRVPNSEPLQELDPNADRAERRFGNEHADSDRSVWEQEDDASDSDDDQHRVRAKKPRKKKPKPPKHHEVIRKSGIAHVTNDKWEVTLQRTENCHIVVSSNSVNNTSILKGNECVASSKADAAVAPPLDGEGRAQPGGIATTTPLAEAPFTTLPLRVTIVNELLLREVSIIWSSKDGAPFELMNHDHVAPFRSIIPLEAAFRHKHNELEAEFERLRVKHPSHAAVTRDTDYLPSILAYGQSSRAQPSLYVDEIDKARILLDGFRALVHLLDTSLRNLVDSYRRIESGTIEKLPFAHLWFLFKPGQEIVSRQPRDQVYRVLRVTGGRKSLVPRSNQTSRMTVSDLVIDCFYLDFDGYHFGPVPTTIVIKPFHDARPIADLAAHPLNFDKRSSSNEKEFQSILEELRTRGQKFEGLVHVSHRRYKGLSLRENEAFDTLEEIDSDVIIDFELAYRNSERHIPRPKFGGGVIANPTLEDDAETNEPGWWYDDLSRLTWRCLQWSQNTSLLHNHAPGDLPEGASLLLPARVYGYVLLNRKWYPLDCELIETVPPVSSGGNDSFDRLVLPPGHRDIVRALVKTHARKISAVGNASRRATQRDFDLVRGKGRGLIILLHGAPGVGKTSTAECVASNAGKPLFPITCGDLGGETAQEVENKLDRFFDLARKWNCVLLLDEADVFLSARVAGNIQQNSLVSVFLRVLEYYSGILILTTNRVGSFDEAIKSRVHCALYYPPLDEDQTLRVWQMNLDAIEDRNKTLDRSLQIRVKRQDIEDFARRQWKTGRRANRWNGRQIKNAFQTAVALADWDTMKHTEGAMNSPGPLLEPAHFEKVAEASRHFDNYLERVRRPDHEVARATEMREDDVTYDLADGDRVAGQSRTAKPTRESQRRRAKSGKAKLRTKSKHRPPEPPSEVSDSDESVLEDDDSAERSGDTETDDTAEDSSPSPPPEPRKKSGKKRKAKIR